MSGRCSVPVSIGELWDKYCILLIKREKIKDTEKKALVETEINELLPLIEKFPIERELQNEMYDVNCSLWELEDRIRILGETENFLVGPSKQVIEFIEISKSIYSTNDNRYKVKRKINEIWKSHIMEVKSLSLIHI